MTTTIESYVMTAVGEPFAPLSREVDQIPDGEALVRVAGCGVCHTDISFLHQGVAVRADLPLTLGHEIAGIVEAVGTGTDDSLVGKSVIVPAVMPCGECDTCKSNNRRICPNQIMPGNDRHGGFATHAVVPARYLCPVPEAVLAQHELWELAVVADAITTPYQAVVRSDLSAGQLAVVIGTGGIGIHAVQIAAARGAHVIAIDIDDQKLEVAAKYGAVATINSKELSVKELRKLVSAKAKELGAAKFGSRIYETSGSKPGQELAFALVGKGSVLAVIGFTMDKLELRLSNLMAFDATAFGNWGCDAELYPEVMTELAEGRIQLKPFVESHGLADINRVFDDALHHRLQRRAVLCP